MQAAGMLIAAFSKNLDFSNINQLLRMRSLIFLWKNPIFSKFVTLPVVCKCQSLPHLPNFVTLTLHFR